MTLWFGRRWFDPADGGSPRVMLRIGTFAGSYWQPAASQPVGTYGDTRGKRP